MCPLEDSGGGGSGDGGGRHEGLSDSLVGWRNDKSPL
jgi:hypothetical protein